MLSYQHAYHAGNFADVIKHTLLGLILHRLAQKPKGFTYYETHAGRGVYPVDLPEMAKKSEFFGGLGKVWDVRLTAPPSIDPYLQVVERLNPSGVLGMVPGSPTLARYLTREADMLHLCELHPAERAELQRRLGGDKRVRIHPTDGYLTIPDLVPPPTSRGVVMIDPSYEVKSDYLRVVDVVGTLFDRWPQACVLVWYPLLAEPRHAPLVGGLTDLGIPATWLAEAMVFPHSTGMCGTGAVVLGMPWKLETPMAEAVHWLTPALGGEAATCDCRMLVSPR